MTTRELDNLKIGDICIFKRGYNQGRICEVVYIEDGTICVRSIDGKPFTKSVGTCRKLELENWRNLGIAE